MSNIHQNNTINYLPLSSSQIPFYSGQRMYPEAPLYNMPFAFYIASEIDENLFKLAFQLTINKTDILRTIFTEKNGVPYQYTLDEYLYDLPLLDFSGKTEQEISKWIDNNAQKLLTFDKPLFESVLIKKSDNQYIWYINQHHLITDAWACTVLFETCMTLYATLKSEQPVSPDNLPNYADYVNNNLSLESQNKVKKVSTYWNEKYKSLPQGLRFYGKRKRKTNTLSNRVAIHIGDERSIAIRDLVKDDNLRGWSTHMSLYNFFATVLYIYIFRVTESEAVSIDMPFHNRTTPIDKKTIGAFIEMFPFKIEMNHSDTFLEVYQKVRLETNEVFKNIEKGASINQFKKTSNVVLNYINADFIQTEGVEVTSSNWIHSGHVDPTHHLRLQVYDFNSSGAFKTFFDLNNEIFDNVKQDMAPDHFLTIIDAFIEDYNEPIGKKSLITSVEKELLVAMGKGPTVSLKDTDLVLNKIQEVINRNPNHTAIIDKSSNHLTFKQLDELSNQFANYLSTKEIGLGHTVAMYTYRSSALIVAILGTLKAGATFVPISSNTPTNRVNYILEDAEVNILLSHQELTDKLESTKIPVIIADQLIEELADLSKSFIPINYGENHIAYMIYTSGSTGNPKGVKIPMKGLDNYLKHCEDNYLNNVGPLMPLYSMIGFDLTITSIFLPLISAGTIYIYRENSAKSDLSIVDVIADNHVDIIKLTPSHWDLVAEMDFSKSKLKKLIVGGEAFTPRHVASMRNAFSNNITLINEYGPTEATVGCIVHKLDPNNNYTSIVPIGKCIANMEAMILDEELNRVPLGAIGQLYLSGAGLANGYQNNEELSHSKFIPHLDKPDVKMYATGDYCRFNNKHLIEYLGRRDEQIKVRGVRVELGEIESLVNQLGKVENCAVTFNQLFAEPKEEEFNCVNCGLPSNFPTATFDENQVCNLCNSFDTYENKASQYFKPKEELKERLLGKKDTNKKYDCMMLLSGGKDSSYALGQLVDMGLNVLAFTLDNGYISEEALANVRRIVKELNVDHVFGQTEAMNAIFVDSLRQHSNVCNGCFKVLYSLSTKIALEKEIPYIVTGLSRGQFFETRLTEELFWNDNVDLEKIDDIILNARKAYHRIDDAISHYLDTDFFDSDEVFEKVQFLDFYRYSDVSMDEMMEYLDKSLPWIRPSDTGRSTNCLINQVGIYVHKKTRGYSNYAFPYSWDVRLGHKNRDAALEEINEELNEKEIYKIMSEIGYHEELETPEDFVLTVNYIGNKVDEETIKNQLKEFLPPYLIPTKFIQLSEFPLTNNGKIDRKALEKIVHKATVKVNHENLFIAPDGPIEEVVAEIWQEVLNIDKISTNYKFLEIGGNSLAAIRINSRILESINLELPLALIFEYPTIQEYASMIEKKIVEMMDE